ncbi:MAG: lysophospholipid acyltransferase family protein [Myxococcota bacterium]
MKLGYRLEYYGFRLGATAVRWLPLSASQRFAAWIAERSFARGGKRVRYTLANLRLCFPELSERERYEIGRVSYIHLAWNAVDFMRLGSWSEQEIRRRFRLEGVEHYQAALAEGRGVMLLTLHLGNFELGALGAPLYGVGATWVGRPMSNTQLYRYLSRQRTRTGGGLIGKRNIAPSILRVLRKGGAVGILNDQYTRRSQGVFAPFFGLRCSTSPGVAMLALRSGALVLPTYVVRDAPDHHTGRILPPLKLELSGDRRLDIAAITAACNEAYESIIRRHPDQYWWFTRRFRHSPDLDRDPYDDAPPSSAG